jgi:hypothetical protein
MTEPSSTEVVEERKKAVVGALELCVARSDASKVVKAGTVEMYFTTHGDEVWGQNEVRLEGVWQMLCNRPGLSAKEVSPALLVLKSFEQSLGMVIKLPTALEQVPPSEGVRLRGALALDEAELQRVIDGSRAVPSGGALSASAGVLGGGKSSTGHLAVIDRGKQVVTAVVLGVVTLAILGAGLYVAFRQTDEVFDVSDVAALVRLVDARRDGEGLVARIADGQWETMSGDRQKEVARQVFDKQRSRGIKSMTLLDAGGQVRVQVMEINGTTLVSAR